MGDRHNIAAADTRTRHSPGAFRFSMLFDPDEALWPRRIFWLLTVCVCILAAISLVSDIGSKVLSGEPGLYAAWLRRRFYLDGERFIPTTFSSAILLYSACLLAVIAYRNWRDSKPSTMHWWVLSIGFVYLAIDESASRILDVKLHEEVFDFLIPILGIQFIHFWVIPVSVLLLVFLLLFLPFLRALTPRFRRLFILSGAIYVSGALGLEAAGGLYAELDRKGGPVYSLLMHLEETCEMMGIVFFIYALHAYLLSMSQHAATGAYHR